MRAKRWPILLVLGSLFVVPVTCGAAPLDEKALLAALDAKDLPRAVALAQAAADTGDPVGMAALGEFHYLGAGLPKDFEEARRLYLQAAKLGYADAQYRAAFMCRKGEGGPIRIKDALHWYEKAAKAGNTQAAHELAMMYEAGDGLEADPEAALKWHEVAAGGGNPESEYALGNRYFEGRGVERNLSKAFDWYQKAADQGLADAQNDVAFLYEKGLGDLSVDEDKAVSYYRLAANQGHHKAHVGLGRLLLSSNRRYRDVKAAIALLLPEATSGDPEAQFRLGCAYSYPGNNDNSKPNPKEGFRWFLKAAENEKVEAYADVGLHYENGEGVKQNGAEAFRWYQKGADQGDPWCLNNLGNLYAKGVGVKADEEAAIAWYKKAAEAGHRTAPADVGDFYQEKGNWSEALKWYRRAVDNGNGITACYVGDHYNVDVNDCPWDDPAEALKWYHLGAALGNIDCARRAGHLHHKRNEYRQAAFYYKKAQMLGTLGTEDEKTLASIEDYLGNYEEAAKLFEHLATAPSAGRWGDAEAKAVLAGYYAEGKGVPIDRKRAQQLLDSASLAQSFQDIDRQTEEAERLRREEEDKHGKSAWDPDAANLVPCPTCNGTGRNVAITCQTCGGRGKVHVKK